MQKKIITGLILLFLMQENYAQCFTLGADLSYTNTVLTNGGVFHNENNLVVNPYEYFAQKGANMTRMRLFHTPQNNTNYCGNPISANDINDVILGFTNAKVNGMKLNLAIHYGDYFNDPTKQKRPQAWTGQTGTTLLNSIYSYTYSVLQTLKNNNVTPDIVAIGNETTWGFIDDTATTNGWTWPEDANKYNTAFSAVDDFNAANATSIKKAVHFTDNTASWLAGLFTSQGITNYDMIGISYYPVWSNFTNLSQLGSLVNTLKTTYNKEIMIFETGVPWTTSSSDNYSNIVNSYGNLSYPITPLGQKQFFNDLANTVYNAGGKGVLYWEPDWISSTMCDLWGQGSSYENMSFFDFNFNNKALPIFDVFNFCNNLSLNELKNDKVYFYPNPTKDEITFSGIENGSTIAILDIYGRLILSKTLIDNKISLSELSKGIYFLNFNVNNSKITEKIIIE